MAKRYQKKTKFVRKAKTYKKASMPRSLYPNFPDTMNLSVGFVQSSNYQVGAAAYAAFTIQPMTIFQLDGQGPGFLANLMRHYELAHVMSATVRVTFMSREVGNAESLNIVAAPVNSRDIIRVPAFGTFSGLQSAYRAQNKFLAPTSGGSSQQTFSHNIVVQTPVQSSYQSANNSYYDAGGQFGVSGPAQGALLDSPAIMYMYTPVEPAQCNFQVTRKIVFHLHMSRPHYPRAPFAADVPVNLQFPQDEFHQMETESMSDQVISLQRQVTQGFQRLGLNNKK